MESKRVLVVEDEPIFRMDLVLRLKRLGFEEIVETAFAEESVSLVREQHYDLVLMDIRLKGVMSGLEAAEQIARDRRCPIIVMSAYQLSETQLRERVPSLMAFIPKPISDSILEVHARRVVQRTGAAADRAEESPPRFR